MNSWIKMGVNLRTHPKIVRLSSALKADKNRVLGGLFSVWCVFDAHSEDGKLEGYTLDAMDTEIGWKGFSAALEAIGWLESCDDGLIAPRFEEHNGATAKRRALDASRKGKTRHSSASSPQHVRIANGVDAGQMSALEPDKMRNREEKRREENKKKNQDTTDENSPKKPDDFSLAPPAANGLNGHSPILKVPVSRLIAEYHEVLPELPKVRRVTSAREAVIRSRWKEEAHLHHWITEAEGLEHFRKFFKFVRDSKFLMGQSSPQPGRTPFEASLEWLMSAGNFAKVIEGNFHR